MQSSTHTYKNIQWKLLHFINKLKTCHWITLVMFQKNTNIKCLFYREISYHPRIILNLKAFYFHVESSPLSSSSSSNKPANLFFCLKSWNKISEWKSSKYTTLYRIAGIIDYNINIFLLSHLTYSFIPISITAEFCCCKHNIILKINLWWTEVCTHFSKWRYHNKIYVHKIACKINNLMDDLMHGNV